MTWRAHLWNRLKAVPLGVWAALGAALTILLMFLRGRRLEAELARQRLRVEAADAAALSARSDGAARVHLDRADEHAAKADALQDKAIRVRLLAREEHKRLAALPPDAVTDEYLKLAEKKRVDRGGS
jgi:hypothetical protein